MTGREAHILDTIDHIQRVQTLLSEIIVDLQARVVMHDRSKLLPPEMEGYAGLKDALNGLEYGTDEYCAALEPFKTIINHHYLQNDHHPEHFQAGIDDMDLLQIIEMVCDWKAASTRNSESLIPSLGASFERFGIGEQLGLIIHNTVTVLGW